MSESRTSLRPEDMRSYVAREWERTARAKRSRWLHRRSEVGPAEGFRVGAALYEHARQTRADWPTHRSRSEDLKNHIALVQLLDAFARSQTLR